jgi:F-type H+-transporting ATPase subunit a
MPESEIFITRIFNDYLPGVGNAILHSIGLQPQPRPWANFVVMQIVVVLLIMITALALRTRLSAENPGRLQHVAELFYEFVLGQAEGQISHGALRYVSFFGTLFVFILLSNLIGLIPILESPTKTAAVTCGCALATFFYYNLMGVRVHGFKYILHFMGPKWWLAPLMFPIEIVSHMARPLSLTIRLYANMFAGEQVTLVFLHLTYFLVPAVFMGLHMFVGIVQAYIFMLLAMAYVGGSVALEQH